MKRWIQLIKGISYIALGFCFFSIKFYEIKKEIVLVDGSVRSFLWWIKNGVDVSLQIFNDHFDDFFKQNGLNLVVSLLFITIGVLELIQVKGMKSNGN